MKHKCLIENTIIREPGLILLDKQKGWGWGFLGGNVPDGKHQRRSSCSDLSKRTTIKKWNFKVLRIIHWGTLNLCLKMPDTKLKESVQSYHPALRKHPKCGPILLNKPNILACLDVFSQNVGPIELIPFALGQASPDTSLQYPQHNILATLKFHFFRFDPP
jgi:hypothetical protein